MLCLICESSFREYVSAQHPQTLYPHKGCAEMEWEMIRPAEKQDASRISEILIFAKRKAYRPIFKNDFVSFHEMQVLNLALEYRDIPDMIKDVYVYDDGIIKGMMSWKRGTENHTIVKSQWELRELYIDPFFQNQGIGYKLIMNFITNANQENVQEVFLWVLEENRYARQFYERQGFSFDGTKKLQPGTDAFLLKYVKAMNSGV